MKRILLFLFSHRTLALLRWDIYFMRLRLSNFLLGRKRILAKLLARPSDKKYLNLGSGPRGIDDNRWINIDGFKDKNVHYCCDFNREMPFANETFDGIFCEHVLEHFAYEDGRKMMQECLRVLKKGGAIRIVVPDGEKILKTYFDDPAKLVKYKDSPTGHAMEAVNSWFYQRYEHQCIYDGSYLTGMMKDAGYSAASKSAYQLAHLHQEDIVIDDAKYSWESLYVDAIK